MNELQMLAIAYIFFMSLIGLELLVSLWKRDGGYRLGEAVVNIGHGVLYQVFDFLTKGLVALPFIGLAALVSWRLLPTDALWGWVVGLILYDFTSYWAHRHHHEIHGLWAIHGTHHAAEDFNLAAALRQPAFQRVFSWLWRLPLALVIPAEMLVGLVVFDFLYQFVLHTRYVGKLGPIEWIMNTPSHHRVHHGTEAKYLDKNHGGILIIWDRLFGTFQEEEEEPTYGLTKPLGTFNAAWGNLAIHAELMDASRKARGLDKLRVWLAGPEHLEQLVPEHRYEAPPTPDEASVPVALKVYVFVHGAITPALLGWMTWAGDDWSWMARLAYSAFLVASVVLLGALLERKPWAIPLESARLLLGAMCGAVLLEAVWPLGVGLVLLSGFVWCAIQSPRNHAVTHQPVP